MKYLRCKVCSNGSIGVFRWEWQRWKITSRSLVPKILFWSMIAMGSCNRLNYPNMNEISMSISRSVDTDFLETNKTITKTAKMYIWISNIGITICQPTSTMLLLAFFPVVHNVNLVFYSSLTSLLACNSWGNLINVLAKVKQWERKITTILLLPWLVLYCLMRRLVVQLAQTNALFRYRQSKAFQKQCIYLTNSCNLFFFSLLVVYSVVCYKIT